MLHVWPGTVRWILSLIKLSNAVLIFTHTNMSPDNVECEQSPTSLLSCLLNAGAPLHP